MRPLGARPDQGDKSSNVCDTQHEKDTQLDIRLNHSERQVGHGLLLAQIRYSLSTARQLEFQTKNDRQFVVMFCWGRQRKLDLQDDKKC